MDALKWAETESDLEEILKSLASAKNPDASKLKAARVELSEHIADGAKACPECKTKPHGMKKNPSTYEIGCITCLKPKRARAGTAAGAVVKWNKGEYVEEVAAA